MIFGTVNNIPIIEKGYSKATISGAQIVGNDFLNQLIKHSRIFEEFHFFLENPSIAKSLNMLFDERIKVKDLYSIKKNDLSGYVFHTLNPNIYSLCCLRKYSKKPFPITGITYSLGIPTIPKLLLFTLLSKKIYECDALVCSSLACKKVVENILASLFEEMSRLHNIKLDSLKLRHIPFGVDTELFKPENKENAKQALRLPDKLILLCVTRIDRAYKMDLFPLIMLVKNLKDAVLVIAGQAEHCTYVDLVKRFVKENGIGDRVVFFMNFEEKIKPLLYQAADIFISLADNIQETFGITILEAMSSGLPVIASDWNGYKELVIHNKTGFRIPTYWCSSDAEEIFDYRYNHLCLAQSLCIDQEKLLECITMLLEDDNLRTEFGKAARQCCLDNYKWKDIISKYEKLWLELKESSVTKKEPFEIECYKIFKHYATSELPSNTAFRITEYGRTINVDDFFKKYGFDKINSLSKDTVKKILNGVTLKTLNIPENELRYNLLWMLKHGLIAIQK